MPLFVMLFCLDRWMVFMNWTFHDHILFCSEMHGLLYFLCLQVVMPTVEADVAFGLGKLNLTPNEIKTRVAKALDAVGMYEYLKVCSSGIVS